MRNLEMSIRHFFPGDKRASNDNTGYYRWIDAIFDMFLRYSSNWWQKGPEVTDHFKTQTLTGKYLRADRVLLNVGLVSEPRFIVKIDKENKRIGRGRGKLEYSRLLELQMAARSGWSMPGWTMTAGWSGKLRDGSKTPRVWSS